jgi:hypothetical protein
MRCRNIALFTGLLAAGCGGVGAPFAFTVREGGPDVLEQDAGDVVDGSAGDVDGAAPSPEAAVDGELGPGEAGPGPGSDGSDGSAQDAPAPVCLTDLSGVGSRDFRISFRLTTTASGHTYSILSQRAGCDTASVWWDVTLQPLGGVELATDDGTPASYVFVEAGDSVNDGQPHTMAVGRTGGAIWTSTDGVIRSSLTPDPSAFGTFPALSIGSTSCSSETPMGGHGTISDVCITMP